MLIFGRDGVSYLKFSDSVVNCNYCTLTISKLLLGTTNRSFDQISPVFVAQVVS